MKKRLGALTLLAASVSLPCMVAAATDTFPAKPMFKVGPYHNDIIAPHRAAKNLPQWNGSYTDLTKKTITFTQIGGNPATTNTTSTVKVLIIPIKFVMTQSGKQYIFDPLATLSDNKGRTVPQAMVASPLFSTKLDFAPQWGSCASGKTCVDLGQTQYIDAFQRGTWWGNNVSSNTSYHVILKPKVEPEQEIDVTCTSGCVGSEFGVQVGLYNFGTMDTKLRTFMKSITDVNPGVFPLFVSFDVYLTSGGCCIGGYHDSLSGPPGGQTYGYSTYVDHPGAFSQDVEALSHEIGEWMDDPFIGYNNVNCQDNGWMEVGDPLENGPDYGGFKYKSRGYTWNLQSLVYMPYFGAPTSDSANSWYAIQDDMSHVCPGQ